MAGRSLLCAGFLFFASGVVNAQDAMIEEIVVTGSYIRGTPTDAELPVDVINRQDMEEVGSPSVIELVRNLGVTSGNIGETNQFQAGGQANEGMATINLRGLGAARTLVLINGRRHVSTEANGVDINAMPVSAIGRMEVLKDGAAALYGSDAIGGVVNFITREGFEGLEIGGAYQAVDDGGDWDIHGIFGTAGDRWNWMIAAEYGQRKEVQIKDRDWALRPYSENPQGGWSSISNPANIVFPDAGPIDPDTDEPTDAVAPDPRCEDMGAWRDSLSSCGFQYTFFDNLIEKTKQTKVFSEFNFDITPTSTFHIEGLYSFVDLPEWKTSPSYPPQSLFGTDRVALADHPGLVDLRAQYPDLPQATDGAGYAIPINRARGVIGKDGEPESSPRETKTYRVAAGLDGTLFDDQLNYDISVSWSKRERDIGGNDMFIERMGFAMRGFGGVDCDRSVAGGVPVSSPGAGNCEYYNPFSNSIEQSVVSGFVNPDYNPAVGNSDAMFDWLIADTGSSTDNELLVFDAIFSGDTGVQLGGGTMGYALGGQVRRERYDFGVEDTVDRSLNPCAWQHDLELAELLGFDTSCPVPSGQLAFLAAADEERTSRRVYGLFGELALPITDTFNLQLAVRFEDYGGNVGSTIDPKAAFSWNFAEGFTLRGSASTTFRGPPQSFLSGVGTALQFIPAQNAFKAVDTLGNEDLSPEKALTTNLGFIYQNEVFYGSIDFWRFDFEDSFQTESAQQISAAYFGEGCEIGGAGDGTERCEGLRSHVFPYGTDAAGLERIESNIINGSDITTSGLDLFAQYDFHDVGPGTLGLGIQGTYVFEYESDDFLDINGLILAPGGDFAGFLNDGDPFTPKPEVQGNVFARYDAGIHHAQFIVRYVNSYDDVRPSLPELAKVDSFTTIDLHYNVALFNDTTDLSVSVLNVADEDPPMASTDLNYDAFTHSAFGRMIKLGIRYRFNP
jgi:outer membrane receptor protein involved in Fe transport